MLSSGICIIILIPAEKILSWVMNEEGAIKCIVLNDLLHKKITVCAIRQSML